MTSPPPSSLLLLRPGPLEGVRGRVALRADKDDGDTLRGSLYAYGSPSWSRQASSLGVGSGALKVWGNGRLVRLPTPSSTAALWVDQCGAVPESRGTT